ncbi:hypothetical protein Egran_00998 [Elaphomyces granulatus]|uniref:C2H2-type domain-containing protein n=1 Tax=Elaphomyces granulatus TaxID=519963 RepID=A0A232M4H6_9EURO|nr:hypothetical protein Egran_00998 [Elaphomyces granulatus]
MVTPVLRKGRIISSSLPPDSFFNTASQEDFIRFHEEQHPLDVLQTTAQLALQPWQSSLESPVPLYQHPFSSPPASPADSPVFSSPTFSTSRSPVTAVSADFSVGFDGSQLETASPSMSVSSSYNPVYHHLPTRPYTPQYPPRGSSPMLVPHGLPQTGSYIPSTCTSTSNGNNSHRHSIHQIAQGWEGDACASARTNGLARRSGIHSKTSSGGSGNAISSPLSATAYTSPSSSSSYAGLDSYQNPSQVIGSKSLPTPVQTPVQISFLAAPFQNYDPSSQNGENVEAEIAMRQAVMEQQQRLHRTQPQPLKMASSHQAAAASMEEDASFHHALAPSVSSRSHHDSPMTPQTTYDDLDDSSKAIVAHGEDRSRDVDRWMMDDYLHLDALSDFGGPNAAAVPIGVYQDELLHPTIIPQPPTSRKSVAVSGLPMPFRNILQAANQGHMSARSQSPAHSMSRERSPFRQGSQLAVDFRTSPLQSSNLAVSMPHGMDMEDQHDPQTEPKTISPKDAVLEFHEGPEDHGLPSLFPSSEAGFPPTQSYSPMDAFPNQYPRQADGLHFLQQPQQQQPQPQQQPPPPSQQGQQQQHQPSQPPPQQSRSEGGQRLSQHHSAGQTPNDPSRRPSDTSSDSGTYTCTYHGCTLRFETPAKLQKHKREAHRQAVSASATTGRDGEGNTLAMRNSQAGPHKCERINPSTGKPCNSIFSRPYDLTRHEDTIHNARKQKVRCHLCTEEKTFSRNDALTRHMRVVHPEVDWPGSGRKAASSARLGLGQRHFGDGARHDVNTPAHGRDLLPDRRFDFPDLVNRGLAA